MVFLPLLFLSFPPSHISLTIILCYICFYLFILCLNPTNCQLHEGEYFVSRSTVSLRLEAYLTHSSPSVTIAWVKWDKFVGWVYSTNKLFLRAFLNLTKFTERRICWCWNSLIQWLDMTYGGRNVHACASGSLHVLKQGMAQGSYLHSHILL